MPGALSLGDQGILLRVLRLHLDLNTENEGIVFETSVNQEPVNETLQAMKSSSKCYCTLVSYFC